MARLQTTAVGEHHAPRQVVLRKTSPQLTVDEVPQPAGGQPQRYTGGNKICHLQPRTLARVCKPPHGTNHTEQTPMKTHTAGPYGKNFEWIGEVIGRLIKQAIPQAPANDH